MPHTNPKPLALVVFLENVGHIVGLKLPQWAMNLIDFVTEEYAKVLFRLYGVYRRYDRVIILEDDLATGPHLTTALTTASQSHQVDVLLLVHGHQGCLVGYKNQTRVGPETFGPLIQAYRQDPSLLDLRMVYGVNCFGITLAPVWLALGAQVANGAVGVNWFPEPSLSVFLWNWLHGTPYSQAVQKSNEAANRFWRKILRPDASGCDHPAVQSSRQTVSGWRDITIHT